MSNFSSGLKRLTIFLLCILLSLFLALILGGLWWRLWMYHGWFGSPHWLFIFYQASGEGAYDIVQLEMIIICWIAIILVVFSTLNLCKNMSQ